MVPLLPFRQGRAKLIFCLFWLAFARVIPLVHSYSIWRLKVYLGRHFFTAAGNGVYEPVSLELQSILNKHKTYASYLGLVNKAEDEVMPKIFAVPKLHKSPYKFRFIASAHNSSIKKHSLLLHRILHFLHTHLRNYAAIASRRTGKRFFWSVDNSEAVIQLLRRAKSSKVVFTADFSTLFTKLPHTVIKTCL